jgi:hypothetical protein
MTSPNFPVRVSWPLPSIRANLVVFGDPLHAEFRPPQQFLNFFPIYRTAFNLRRYNPFGGFSANVRDFALQITHAGLTGVFLNNFQQCLISELDLLVTEPVGFNLLPDQKSLGDFELLIFGIARELDDFHAILKRPRYRV